MKRLQASLAALGLLLATTSCSSVMPEASMAADQPADQSFGFTSFGQPEFSDSDSDGLPDTRLPDFDEGTIAMIDDTVSAKTGDSGGLDNNAPGGPGGAPSSASFFNDGSDDDVRGRGDNAFSDPVTIGRDSNIVAAPERSEVDILARKMIYSASYSIMVAVVDDAFQKLTTRVRAVGGYLSQRTNVTLTLRIPATKFDSFIAELPALGRVISESMQANDVTKRHTDLTIRLENAEKSRQRLLALIEKATKIEDIIKIEAALRRLTGEIERMKGQLKLMADQVAYSTVTVSLHPNAPKAKATKRRQQSRFPWINRIGIEQDLRRF